MTVPESKIRKIFTEDVKWLITIATIIVSIMLSYGSIITKIAVIDTRLTTIETNHLVHIQKAIEDLEVRVRGLEISN